MKKYAYIFVVLLCLASLQLAAGPFRYRAFHLDMRAEVMTMDALKSLADELSKDGINAIIMEYEATFPFEGHATICNANAFTKEEVKDFVNHCSSVGIDVIPLQHCFGHCEHILRHDRYKNLRESSKDPSQVCPLKTNEAVPVFTEIFKEVAALHPSQYFHIGADETYLLGSCKDCRKVDKSKLFVDYINAMCLIVEKMGKTPVIWADIILKYPDSLSELPENLVFVDWNYGWNPNRFGKLDNLFEQSVKMWGAGALRSHPDNWYLTQWMKHFNNIATLVPFAREHGYEGMVQTSWSTSGTYGYYFDTESEVIDMQPVRLVYPMSGFRILQKAFCVVVNSDETFEPEQFIRKYARDNFGFDRHGEDILMKYFSMPQEQINISSAGAKDVTGKPLPQILEECIDLRSEMSHLHPSNGQKEFSHWLLMLDLRINYLKFKEIDAALQDGKFTREEAVSLIGKLKLIIREEERLGRRFEKLNKGYLKNAEIDYFNYIKSFKMKDYYKRLNNILK